jgi:hypothetical protein
MTTSVVHDNKITIKGFTGGPIGRTVLGIGTKGDKGDLGPDSIVPGPKGEDSVVPGPKGDIGLTGLTGASAVAGKLPNSYSEVETPVGTVSAVFEDIPGSSTTITLEESVEIAIMASFQMSTQSGASASTIAIAVNIDGTDHEEIERYLSGVNDTGIGAIVHRSAELAPGTYTLKLRFKRVSGVSTPGVDRADMLVMAMQGAKGVGTPAGGTADQVLTKADSADYNFLWKTPGDFFTYSLWSGTQAEYNALGTYDPSTLYLITA